MMAVQVLVPGFLLLLSSVALADDLANVTLAEQLEPPAGLSRVVKDMIWAAVVAISFAIIAALERFLPAVSLEDAEKRAAEGSGDDEEQEDEEDKKGEGKEMDELDDVLLPEPRKKKEGRKSVKEGKKDGAQRIEIDAEEVGSKKRGASSASNKKKEEAPPAPPAVAAVASKPSPKRRRAIITEEDLDLL